MPNSLHLTRPVSAEASEILSDDALSFVENLVRQFRPRIKELLARRVERQEAIRNGELPDFLESTRSIREGDWKVAPVPSDLQDRRTEITGPVDRKMIINALNSGAKVFMADCEDASTPTWENMLSGQVNLRDAVDRSISLSSPEGKSYKLNDSTATLMVRPRGWHLPEKHVLLDGEAIPGGLFDFGLYFFHNAAKLLARGSGPYFYLPKLESHLEARLWNDVFVFAQDTLKIKQGSIKATVLIETILASFETEEILYELREHSAGLNCGRWDYIFSYIKKFHHDPKRILPDRIQVTMTSPFMRAYCLNVIKNCHRRGAHAMGGMAAQIPIKNDPVANEAALARVLADKEREASDGHDGTWVAHPGLVPIALQAFNKHMPEPNQISKQRPDVEVTAAELIEVPSGTISEKGLCMNISVGIQYLEAWLRGQGCVPLYNLMEDAATAEISRSQVWQWIHHGARLDDGRLIDISLYETLLKEVLVKIEQEVGPERYRSGKFPRAIEIFTRLTKDDTFEEFLTLPAYCEI